MSEMTRRTFTKGATALAPLAFAPFSLVAQTAPSNKIRYRRCRRGTQQSGHGGIQANPVMRNDELHLIRDYGIEYIQADPIYHMPFPDGSYLTQWRDLDRTCEEFAKFSKKDGAA